MSPLEIFAVLISLIGVGLTVIALMYDDESQSAQGMLS
ncbi:hypothetical protein OPU39_18805, partial [Acinetobacter nosocomialis]|nr:hypothetical protein [Acinetobacter nosocomialis]